MPRTTQHPFTSADPKEKAPHNSRSHAILAFLCAVSADNRRVVFGGLIKIFKSIDMYVVGRASFWYALPHPLSPVTQSPNSPPQSPSSALFISSRHPRQALFGATATVCGARSTSFCRR
eukprot:7385080-Prymnesium_polylepis.1